MKFEGRRICCKKMQRRMNFFDEIVSIGVDRSERKMRSSGIDPRSECCDREEVDRRHND